MMLKLTRQFDHQFVDLPKIYSEDTPNGRYYTTPDGSKYQSVTTLLGRNSDNTWLEEWKARVGEEQVSKTSTQAKRRGTAVHAILEQYLLNNDKFFRGHMPVNLTMFAAMRKILDARLGAILGLEIGLWSHNMRVAGRADMLAYFDGVLSIVDFKTSKKPKREEDIESYFLQCTIYALMAEELLGVSVPKIVVLIGVDDEDAQVFIRDKAEFVQAIIDMTA